MFGLYKQGQMLLNLNRTKLINDVECFYLPVGRKRKIQRTPNQRQSSGRFGICGSNFLRRSTTVAVLDAFETADERVRIVNVLE